MECKDPAGFNCEDCPIYDQCVGLMPFTETYSNIIYKGCEHEND